MWLMLVGWVWVMSGCASAPGVPGAESMPQGRSYSGLWYSPQYEHMYLEQSGDRVTGVFSYGSGGTLEGELKGNRLLFNWEEPGDRSQARAAMRGSGYFLLVESGESVRLEGEWGYGEERKGQGPWTAEYIRELEGDDPSTVEQVRQVH
ncbi:hypothetical protein DL240_15100 [Lujinxingia litoralis]|uniref:Lipocalin-like domain-containing protein n=2 Tax=Lujinxingia litoralis TaxID=2211119 RepID=A0A328C2V9_9DELT|nr:hypothetical protein DL240_15100 [Lujinxingia litoralis]